MFNLLAKLRASKARRITKADADSAYRQAHGRYKVARQSGDTQAQHHAAVSLQSAQTARLRAEMGR